MGEKQNWNRFSKFAQNVHDFTKIKQLSNLHDMNVKQYKILKILP